MTRRPKKPPPFVRSLPILALVVSCGGGQVSSLAGPDTGWISSARGGNATSDAHAPPNHFSTSPVPSGAPDFTHAIPDQATWSQLAASPPNAVFARTEVVKVIIDLENGRQIYFPQTTRWPIHYDFARRFLHSNDHPVEDHAAFNVREYRTPGRRFVLGSLVHYLDQDLWTFEMISGDDLDGARVAEAYEQVKPLVFFGSELHYRPLSDLHRRQIASVRDRLNVIETDAVFGAQRYQPLTEGVAYGYLRLVRGVLDQASVRRSEILVTEHVPDDLPLSMGLVTAALQAPLAHVAVLSANRGTPNMALRGALDDARFAALDGQLVKITVGPQDFTIEAADPATANAHWDAMRPNRPFTPQVDTTERGLVDVCSLTANDVRYAGAKAAQLGEVCALGPAVTTPGGFVIPFSHYVSHLSTNHLDAGIAQMLADGAFQSDQGVRAQRLTELRRIFERLPVDRDLVRHVLARVRQMPRGRVIFRSSTNAEDLVGFNGAGLYSSIVIGPTIDEAAVERAIREVWGSVWTQRGFEERDFYRIDHARVAMGILVQPFVADVVANGVAITQNPFNADRPGVFINVQTSRGSVTAAGDAVPEQHLVYTYNAAPEPEVLSRSSLTNGQPILDEAAVLRLTDVLTRLHQRLAPRYPAPANAVDVELLVTRSGQIVVVQARPFTVVWAAPSRYAMR